MCTCDLFDSCRVISDFSIYLKKYIFCNKNVIALYFGFFKLTVNIFRMLKIMLFGY